MLDGYQDGCCFREVVQYVYGLCLCEFYLSDVYFMGCYEGCQVGEFVCEVFVWFVEFDYVGFGCVGFGVFVQEFVFGLNVGFELVYFGFMCIEYVI